MTYPDKLPLLKVVSDRGIFGSQEIASLADRIIDHGNNWKELSRKIIRVGKTIPMDNDAYPDWFRENADSLNGGLKEISDTFIEFADLESAFFKDLATSLKRLA